MEIIKLIGVLVVIVGLALKLDTLATVVVAGIITGLVSGMTPMEILTVLGNAFISQRISTLFVLALPAIGICERYGLKDKAVDLIKKIANATTGRILTLYLAIRVFCGGNFFAYRWSYSVYQTSYPSYGKRSGGSKVWRSW